MQRDQIISYLKSRKMISKVYVYHIVRVRDGDSETPTFESVPIVKEFSEVIPDDLTGVSPKREIDNWIDLLLDT